MLGKLLLPILLTLGIMNIGALLALGKLRTLEVQGKQSARGYFRGVIAALVIFDLTVAFLVLHLLCTG